MPRPSSLFWFPGCPRPSALCPVVRPAASKAAFRLRLVQTGLGAAKPSAAARKRRRSERERDRPEREGASEAGQGRAGQVRGHHLLLAVSSCRSFNSVIPSCSEKAKLEQSVQAAESSIQMLQMESEKLQLALLAAQRERDGEREEKEAAAQERDRAKAETQRM